MPSRPDSSFQTTRARLVTASDPDAVRQGLLALVTQPPLSGLPEDRRGIAELVLAEVLNNIVEHAYSTGSGDIEITVEERPGGIGFLVVDDGAAMPDGPPPGMLPAGLGGDLDHLPEGGFGWHLIRSLTFDLSYTRKNNRNVLSFLISEDQTGSEDSMT